MDPPVPQTAGGSGLGQGFSHVNPQIDIVDQQVNFFNQQQHTMVQTDMLSFLTPGRSSLKRRTDDESEERPDTAIKIKTANVQITFSKLF